MLKLIAMITMLTDHIGVVFFPGLLWLRVIGRLAFPLFAWGIARGYRYTKNVWIYAARLLVIGLVSQIQYAALFHTKDLNVCFTLLTGLMVLKLYDCDNLPVKAGGITALLFIAHYFDLEYGAYGALTILCFHIFWEDKNVFIYQGLLSIAGIMVYNLHVIQLLSVFSSFLTVYWRKYDFRINRYAQYFFYPVHILVLLIARFVIK